MTNLRQSWKIVLIQLILMSVSALCCDTDRDCQVNEFCHNETTCQPCANCRHLNRERSAEICPPDGCGRCLPGYEERTSNDTESLALRTCYLKPKDSDQKLVNHDDEKKPYRVNGWTVFGFGVLGAFVGVILSGVAVFLMSVYKNKKRANKERRNAENRKHNDNTCTPIGTLTSINEGNNLLAHSDAKSHARKDSDSLRNIFKGCSTCKSRTEKEIEV